MAVVHDSPDHLHKDQNRCALMFCMTWVGFFALVGAITFLVSAL
jgi:hypothetical protein